MSRYAIVHLRNGDVEAVFYSPDFETAVSMGIAYAVRSGFFEAELDDEREAAVTRDAREDRRIESEFLPAELLVIKRVFEIGVPV